MSDVELRKRAIFERSAKLFFFCFMNEARALNLAKKVVESAGSEGLLDDGVHVDQLERYVLRVIHSLYEQNEKKKPKLATAPMLGHFNIPKSLDLGAWREFKRSANGQEFYTTCLFYIGGFDLKTISEVQEISDGTVKFRLSHGSKKLGSILLEEYLN